MLLWNEYLRLSGQGEESEALKNSQVVYRGGKPYVVKKADEIGNIF